MSRQGFSDSGAPPSWREYYPHPVKNTTAEEIPACAIMRVTGCTDVGDQTIYQVAKPDGTAGLHLINMPVPIAATSGSIIGYGQATNRYPIDVAYDTGDGTPVLNEDWGPVSGSWLLKKAGSGFRIIGGHRNGRVRADDSGGGSTSNVTSTAIVTDACGASSHVALGITPGTVGKCVLLNEDGAAVDASGTPFTDIDDATDDDKIEFKSKHRVAILAGTIIDLSCDEPIEAGTVWEEAEGETDRKVWAEFTDVTDYLKQLTGFAATKSLYSDGAAATNIKWGGGEC